MPPPTRGRASTGRGSGRTVSCCGGRLDHWAWHRREQLLTYRSRQIAKSALKNCQVQASRTAPISAIPVRSSSPKPERAWLARGTSSCWQG